ncbi:MAG: WecB/TagA/CpsF family glycosyltransferase, partial [Prevotella sp.]|nr:WecB/TagA/CpsF family glycosyltransferase [Prevotella sp.]
RGRVYTFLNPVSYLDALTHKELFGRFDGIFADGSLLVAAISMVYGKGVTRRSCDMTSIGRQLLEVSSETGKSIYYVASKQNDVEKAVRMLQESYPKANIIGYRNGYFVDDDEMDKTARYITELNPDYLVVGMGATKQEEFLLRVKVAGYQGIGFTCGGFIHQTARSEKEYYPEWADRMNLRFLYRMWREPHTRKRYLMAGLIFPLRFVWERFFG